MTSIASTQNWEAQNLKHHVLISIVALSTVDGSRKKSTTWLWTQVFAHTQPLVLFCGLRLKVPFPNTMVVAWMAGPIYGPFMSIYGSSVDIGPAPPCQSQKPSKIQILEITSSFPSLTCSLYSPTKAMFTCFSCLLMVWHAIVLLLMFCREPSIAAEWIDLRVTRNSWMLIRTLSIPFPFPQLLHLKPEAMTTPLIRHSMIFLSLIQTVRFISARYVNNLFQCTTTNGKHDFCTLYQNSLSQKNKRCLRGFCSALPHGMLWALCSTEPLVDWQRIPVTSSPAVCKKSLEAETASHNPVLILMD